MATRMRRGGGKKTEESGQDGCGSAKSRKMYSLLHDIRRWSTEMCSRMVRGDANFLIMPSGVREQILKNVSSF